MPETAVPDGGLEPYQIWPGLQQTTARGLSCLQQSAWPLPATLTLPTVPFPELVLKDSESLQQYLARPKQCEPLVMDSRISATLRLLYVQQTIQDGYPQSPVPDTSTKSRNSYHEHLRREGDYPEDTTAMRTS